MFQKTIARDIIGVWLLFTFCFIGGVVANEMRATSLSLVYLSPESRINQAVAQLKTSATSVVALDEDITRDEMQRLSLNHTALILDARPEVFYHIAHIPSALSLPRDDFKKHYEDLQATLQAHENGPIVVYCASSDCHDGPMVAEALQKLGYTHVSLFRGGWSLWRDAGFSQEKGEEENGN